MPSKGSPAAFCSPALRLLLLPITLLIEDDLFGLEGASLEPLSVPQLLAWSYLGATFGSMPSKGSSTFCGPVRRLLLLPAA